MIVTTCTIKIVFCRIIMRNGEKSATIVEVPKDLEEVVSELRKI